MIYGELDLATEERNAWQAGDYQRAQALAQAIDASEAFDRAEALKGVVEAVRERITEANWRTGKKAELRELVEAIINELAEG